MCLEMKPLIIVGGGFQPLLFVERKRSKEADAGASLHLLHTHGILCQRSRGHIVGQNESNGACRLATGCKHHFKIVARHRHFGALPDSGTVATVDGSRPHQEHAVALCPFAHLFFQSAPSAGIEFLALRTNIHQGEGLGKGNAIVQEIGGGRHVTAVVAAMLIVGNRGASLHIFACGKR